MHELLDELRAIACNPATNAAQLCEMVLRCEDAGATAKQIIGAIFASAHIHPGAYLNRVIY